MKISKIIKTKALPSFCTSNIDVIYSIISYCKYYRLPCLIECTSNQVNQHGGYTKKTPKKFIDEIFKIAKNIKFEKKNIILGGDHLGPLPWKNVINRVALKNSIELINKFVTLKFAKIHIDTSIKCKDDKIINNDIILKRTERILNHPKIKKKIKKKFIIIGTEVPLSGSGDNKKIILTTKKQIENEVRKFKDILSNLKSQNKCFGLVIEPGMKYMHSKVLKPNFKSFSQKLKFSKENNFVFEAHSTDFQSKKILNNLVKNNFKFLKVGPELTFNYSRSLIFMHKIEKNLYKNHSKLIKNILLTMKKNNKYWKDYYDKNNDYQLINSQLDRMRYYFNTPIISSSVKVLKKNINQINFKEKYSLLGKKIKKEFLLLKKKNISNFEVIKFIFISKSLKKYYSACGFKTH